MPCTHRSYRGKVEKIAPFSSSYFQATKPNQKWVTAITEFHLHGQKLYLSPVLDLFNGEIIAYQVEKRPIYPLVSKMLGKAFRKLKQKESPIIHSYQRWHYHMKEYQLTLKEWGITQSMSRKGNFFGYLKVKLLYLNEFESMEHFQQELGSYIHYYSHKRMKAKLNMSPVQYRTHTQQIA